MKLKYEGLADEYRFVKADFVRHGVEDQDAVHFDAKNNFTAEVSESAGNFLLSADSGFSGVFSVAVEGVAADSADEEEAESAKTAGRKSR